MRWLTRIVLTLVALAAAGRASRAAEPDATKLAALIDRHVETRLKAGRVPLAKPADDSEFLRRVYLDLHGVVPTAEQAARFLADRRPDGTGEPRPPVSRARGVSRRGRARVKRHGTGAGQPWSWNTS